MKKDIREPFLDNTQSPTRNGLDDDYGGEYDS